MSATAETPKSPLSEPNTNLAAVRTGLAFERSRIAEDRTLMAVIRTALSLISFGFTISKFFEGMQSSGMVTLREHAPRNFGITLVSMGLIVLVGGIVYYLQSAGAIRRREQGLAEKGLLEIEKPRGAITLPLAVGLLFVGLFVLFALIFGSGPFM